MVIHMHIFLLIKQILYNLQCLDFVSHRLFDISNQSFVAGGQSKRVECVRSSRYVGVWPSETERQLLLPKFDLFVNFPEHLCVPERIKRMHVMPMMCVCVCDVFVCSRLSVCVSYALHIHHKKMCTCSH